MTHRIRFSLVCFALAITVSSGCSDPYSQRRIQRRMDHLTATAKDRRDWEADGVRRMDEEFKTLRKWWKSDSDRFNRRAPTIGDYIW